MSLLNLFILSLPVACVSWTVTHEEIVRELKDWCAAASQDQRYSFLVRKLCYILTCEYCFSHYVALWALLHLAPIRLLVDGWQGFVLAWFACVWVANIYMNLYFRLRLSIRESGARAKETENHLLVDADGEPLFRRTR